MAEKAVDTSHESIEMARATLVFHRDESIKAWPEGIDYSVLMSHVIYMLAEYKEIAEVLDKLPGLTELSRMEIKLRASATALPRKEELKASYVMLTNAIQAVEALQKLKKVRQS